MSHVYKNKSKTMILKMNSMNEFQIYFEVSDLENNDIVFEVVGNYSIWQNFPLIEIE